MHQPIASVLLAALVVFQLKHMLCDFVLQPLGMVQKKGIYLHPAGLLHAGLHAAGSWPAVLLLTRAPAAVALILAGEFLVHYHTDWAKARIDAQWRLTPQDRSYWLVFGLDQLVHQLTYALMLAAASAQL
jgi:hypothetical protein